jgi:flagellar basal-body rod modification protein FlgD
VQEVELLAVDEVTSRLPDDYYYNPDAYKRVPKKELDKNAFLQLFILSLKNQDPTTTQDPSEFMSQMAQFTIMEQLTNMNDTISKMKITQDISYGSSLIGKNVTIDLGKGLVIEDKVEKIYTYQGEVMVLLENITGGAYPLSTIVQIEK